MYEISGKIVLQGQKKENDPSEGAALNVFTTE